MVLGIGIAFAGKDKKGNGFPSGPHYELGLIGRPNTYSGGGADNGNRHTIFIPLDNADEVDEPIKLKMTQGDQFSVVDGDATGDGEAELQIGPGYYAVFARALGKPGGHIDFTAWFTYWMDDPEETLLSDAIWLGNVDLTRESKKPQTVEISKLFYYDGWLLYDADGDLTTTDDQTWVRYNNEWVFNIAGFEEYWWSMKNDGLKRLEVRFYEVPEGYVPPEIPPENSDGPTVGP
jgi:hypothetical protein